MELRSVLVTGGVGFLGSRIVQLIHEKYPKCLITTLDRRSPATEETRPFIRHIRADITSPTSLQEVFTTIRPEAVIHSASLVPAISERYGRRTQALVTKVNVEGTRNVLQAAQNAGVKALVYTSSCTAVTDHLTRSHANVDETWPTVKPGEGYIYGESKAQAEVLVHAANDTTENTTKTSLKTCSLRPAIIFGEGDLVLIPSIVDLITNQTQSPYLLGDGTNMWDLVYIQNVADAHVLALENLLSDHPSAAGEAFFIQNNQPISVRDSMLFIWKEFNGHIPPFEFGIPVSLAWLFGLFAETYSWLSGNPTTLSRGSVMDAVATRYASGEKAMRILGYHPAVGLEEGLRRSCQVLKMLLEPPSCDTDFMIGVRSKVASRSKQEGRVILIHFSVQLVISSGYAEARSCKDQLAISYLLACNRYA